MTNSKSLLGRFLFSMLGFLVYAYSLTVPAVYTKVWEMYDTLPGGACLFWGVIGGALCLLELNLLGFILMLFSNVLMAVSVFFVLGSRRAPRLSFLMFGTAAVIFLASLFPTFFCLDGKTVFMTGYYLWLSSFLLVATGLQFEVRLSSKENVPTVQSRTRQ